MNFNIPGRGEVTIENVILDFNGTIAVDGELIDGVADAINGLSKTIDFHVLTADTFGSVEAALERVACRVVVIPEGAQDAAKRDYLMQIGQDRTLCVGNGRNDALMLKAAILGVAVIQDEGVCTEALLAADIACRSVLNVFAYFKTPGRLVATLRN